MAVVEKVETPEQKQENANSRAEAEAKTKKDILESLDFSAEEERYGEGKEAQAKGKDSGKSESGEEGEEVQGQEEGEAAQEQEAAQEGEEAAEGEEEDLTPEGDDDEVVSKKKVQKRFDTLTAKIKALEREKAERQAEKEMADNSDPDVKKLNAMSNDGLKATRRAIAVALAKATRTGDEAQVEKLIELQEKVDTAIQTVPQRFNKEQVNAYNVVADQIAELGEIEMTEKSATEIKSLAAEVYRENPELQSLKNGQALALKHAYAIYKERHSKTVEKSKTDNLRRENTNLKRKTSLDSGGLKRTQSNAVQVDKLRQKAKAGDTRDRINLIKNDPAFGLDALIPAEYKEE